MDDSYRQIFMYDIQKKFKRKLILIFPTIHSMQFGEKIWKKNFRYRKSYRATASH